MDVYVATKAENYRVARLFMYALGSAGHAITHDWTQDVAELGPGPEDIKTRRRLAINDYNGVKDCDLFILIMHASMVGSLIEYGMAVAMNKKILIVVDVEAWPVESIFFDFEKLTFMCPSLHAVQVAVNIADQMQKELNDGLSDDVVEDPGVAEDVQRPQVVGRGGRGDSSY